MGSIADKLGHKRSDIPKPDTNLAIPDARVGIEVEVENYRTTQPTPSLWNAKRDESLRNNGMEFTTTGDGLVGNQIFKAIDQICKFSKDNKFSVGYPRAGIHIHLDCTDLGSTSDADLWNFTQAYMFVEYAMFEWCAALTPNVKNKDTGKASTWRKWTGYSDPLVDSRQDYAELARVLIEWKSRKPAEVTSALGRTSKYQAINFIPLLGQGTVEFRHMPTVFDPVAIKEWINIILAIKRASLTTMASADFNLCSEFSIGGARRLVVMLLGEFAKPLLPYIDDAKAWQAVDAIQAMNGFAGESKKSVSWSDPDSPILIEKFKQDPSAEKPTKAVSEVKIVGFDETMLRGVNWPEIPDVFNVNAQQAAPRAPRANPAPAVRNHTAFDRATISSRRPRETLEDYRIRMSRQIVEAINSGRIGDANFYTAASNSAS